MKHNRLQTYLSLIIIFLLFSLYAGLYAAIPHGAATGRFSSMDVDRSLLSSEQPGQAFTRTYMVTKFYYNELWNDIEFALISASSLQEVQAEFLRFYKFFLPILGTGVIYYYIAYITKKKRRIKSIMSMSIGGHAPPILYFI